MTRVLIVAASAVVRAGLEALLASNPALQVIGSATPAADLAPAVEAGRPDVLLLELEHGQSDVSLLPTAEDGPAIVVLAGEMEAGYVRDLLQHGVHAVLPREADAAEIAAGVQAAAAGLVVMHAETAAELLPPRMPVRQEGDVAIEALTPREIEVLGMLAEGTGNKQIAQRLHISEHTVKFHIGSIFAKLGASSRTEAVTLGIRRGIIMI